MSGHESQIDGDAALQTIDAIGVNCQCHGFPIADCPTFLARTRARWIFRGVGTDDAHDGSHFTSTEFRRDHQGDAEQVRHSASPIAEDARPIDHFRVERATAGVGGTGANARQEGGAHYGLSVFQHWDMVALFKLDYFQGQVTKYVMRWKKKNGLEDLKKAKHFLEKYIELIEQGKVDASDK